MDNKTTGKKGEELAKEHLKNQGLKIIETNWRYSRYGEIDIIALDKDILAFIEVKARSSVAFGHPLEAINKTKIEKIRKIASVYIAENQQIKCKGYRFDAVSIILGKNPEITHLKNAY